MAGTVVLKWRGDEASKRTEQAALTGLRLAAEHLLSVSRQQAPIDEGTLRRSAAVTQATNGRTQAVSYDTPYARRQHEELGYRHPQGGKAKYLEDPAREEEPVMRRIFETQLRRLM